MRAVPCTQALGRIRSVRQEVKGVVEGKKGIAAGYEGEPGLDSQ